MVPSRTNKVSIPQIIIITIEEEEIQEEEEEEEEEEITKEVSHSTLSPTKDVDLCLDSTVGHTDCALMADMTAKDRQMDI